ncbi:MAG: hypothetical protein IJM46_09425 [Oscillospiraceae bacterium]|nr:hypothetical protein [Oscillospiraceae bacterium]
MNLIRDIRVYRSETENIAGNPLPAVFINHALCHTLRRITMKLHETGFSMGGFHHLYVNLTTCAVPEQLAPAKRGRDRYSPWYRWYDAEISRELYDLLETPQCIEPVIGIITRLMQRYFSTETLDADAIARCISEAVTQGEQMLVKYKEKQSAKQKAVLYLRYTDGGLYRPLLRVFDSEDRLILEQNLPETAVPDTLGEIQLSAKKVTARPRKSAAVQGIPAVTFPL